jgi:hypothetical protein
MRKFMYPGKMNAGDLAAFLKENGLDVGVTCYVQEDGNTYVEIDTDGDIVDILRNYQPPERGKKRRETRERLEGAKTIAELRTVLLDVLDSVQFSDD